MNCIKYNLIYEIEDIIDNNYVNYLIENYLNKKIDRNFTEVAEFDNNKFIDKQLSEKFFDLVNRHAVNKLGDNTLYGANKYIMTGKYIKNQQFGIHTDTGLYFNLKENVQSKYTLLIYLNDDYEGGETVFYLNDEKIIIKPQKGKAIIFDMQIPHSSNLINNGIKYWIGCEILGNIK